MKRALQTIVLLLAVQAAFAQWPCQAYFNYNADTMNSNLNLYDQSFNMDSSMINITGWTWTVTYGGASYTYTTQDPVVPMPPAFSGWVGVCLSITTPVCSSTWCDSLNWGNVAPPPDSCTAFFEIGSIIGPDYLFLDESFTTVPGASIISWDWVVTDSLSNILSTANTQNLNFTIPYTGFFEICLTILTDAGCSSTFCSPLWLDDSTQNNCTLYLSPTITHVSVIGGSDGAIELNVTGGTAPYAFLWNTGATSEDIFGLTSGLYTVNISQADTMCPAYSATFTIIEPYDTIPLDTLLIPPIDTCLGFVPDTFFVTLVSVDPAAVTVTWTFQGQGMSQNITVVYGISNYGNYVISITINCDSAKTQTTYMTYIYVSQTFGMEESTATKIKLWPNPVSEAFNLSIPELTASVNIYNEMGQLFYSIIPEPGDLKINTSGWPAGLYLIRLQNSEGAFATETIIKK